MSRRESALTPSIEQLRVGLFDADPDTSGMAAAGLIRMGTAATPVFLEALTHAHARTRRIAAEGLGEVADPASANALFEATHDTDGTVRARAATALHRLGDSRALAALIATLNDYPDVLHSPYTASMYPLMRGGKAVLPLVIPLLQASDALTRERAFLVLQAAVRNHYPKQDWLRLWQSLGSYAPDGGEPERENAARQWQTWAARQA